VVAAAVWSQSTAAEAMRILEPSSYCTCIFVFLSIFCGALAIRFPQEPPLVTMCAYCILCMAPADLAFKKIHIFFQLLILMLPSLTNFKSSDLLRNYRQRKINRILISNTELFSSVPNSCKILKPYRFNVN
jgi:hypothetical protein